MPSASRRGINREREVRRLLEAEGWWVGRCAGSLGDADLVALRAKVGTLGETFARESRLVEVKSTTAGPWHSFGPEDRADLLAAAEKAGAEAWLVWWPPRATPMWIPACKWPRRGDV